jgi:hypothetical protein
MVVVAVTLLYLLQQNIGFLFIFGKHSTVHNIGCHQVENEQKLEKSEKNRKNKKA